MLLRFSYVTELYCKWSSLRKAKHALRLMFVYVSVCVNKEIGRFTIWVHANGNFCVYFLFYLFIRLVGINITWHNTTAVCVEACSAGLVIMTLHIYWTVTVCWYSEKASGYFTRLVGFFRIILDSMPTVADKRKYKQNICQWSHLGTGVEQTLEASSVLNV